MAWENVVDKIGKRLHGDVCPNCGALWEDMTSCSNCGYSPKIIACPKCATIKECRSIYTNKMLLTHPEKVSYLDSCKCNVPYVELNMTNEEYDQMWLDHLNYETWWPDWWRRSVCTLANFVAARYIIPARLSQRKAAQKDGFNYFPYPSAEGGSFGYSSRSKLSNGPFFPERWSLVYSTFSSTSLSISFLAWADGSSA